MKIPEFIDAWVACSGGVGAVNESGQANKRMGHLRAEECLSLTNPQQLTVKGPVRD